MSTLFGAIADDFTGATDLAGLLARSGAPVSLRIGVPPQPPTRTAALEIIALKCRTAPVDDAVAECRAALKWLRGAGAERFFWKYCSTFDSTATGNIGPVAEALMADLGVEQTTYCPAFPENGRAVFMGNLFVGELPLAESPMKDHPLTPMRDSNLLRLLEPQVSRPVGLANRLLVARGAAALRVRLAELAEAGIAHVVIDAVADEDLAVIAEACHDRVLATGGSAVAMPLPGIWLEQGLLERDRDGAERQAPVGGALLLSGSCSAMSNRQVAAYRERGAPTRRLDPMELAERGAADAVDWIRRQPADSAPLVYATAEPAAMRAAQQRLGVAEAGEIVEAALAECAVAAREHGYRRFVVAGGESSGAVTRALGVDRLDIGAEIAPGVPWCYADSAGQAIAITLKSGNFGAESFFADALERLDR